MGVVRCNCWDVSRAGADANANASTDARGRLIFRVPIVVRACSLGSSQSGSYMHCTHAQRLGGLPSWPSWKYGSTCRAYHCAIIGSSTLRRLVEAGTQVPKTHTKHYLPSHACSA